MRRAARRDDNEPDIVDVFDSRGVVSQRVSDEGIPDRLCAHKACGFFLVEIKMPKGKLTPAQVAFFAKFQGFPVYKAHSPEMAHRVLDALGVPR